MVQCLLHPSKTAPTFILRACGTDGGRLTAVDGDLYLVWDEGCKFFDCCKGRKNLTALVRQLGISVDNVTGFLCSADSTKVIIKSSGDVVPDISLFVHLINTKDVRGLLDFLLDKCENDIERYILKT